MNKLGSCFFLNLQISQLKRKIIKRNPGAAEPGVQGVQLHTHYLLLPLIKTIHFSKKIMNITSLHTHILEASADPENDAGAAQRGVQGVQLHTHYLLLSLIKTIHFPKFL